MISRETLFPKPTGGSGGGIKGTWDVTPTVTPAQLPNILQLVKSTYANTVVTENFSLSGAPEVFGVSIDSPITLSSGSGKKVFGSNFLSLPSQGTFGFLLIGYTDSPATIESDVLGVVLSQPVTASNFLLAGAGWQGGSYGFGGLANIVKGTSGNVPAPVLASVTASSVVGFYLDVDNGSFSYTLDGASLTSVPFAAQPDGDTVYPFAVFLTDTPNLYDGFQFQMKFTGIQTSVGGVTYDLLGTPEIIQQVSSLPVGAAVNDLYVININESATVKEWMAQPFGIKVSNESIIRVVNATQGSEEISLFNEKVGDSAYYVTELVPAGIISDVTYLDEGFPAPSGDTNRFPDVTSSNGKILTTAPAAHSADNTFPDDYTSYSNVLNPMTETTGVYRIELLKDLTTPVTKQSLTISIPAGTREFSWTAWQDGYYGYTVPGTAQTSLTGSIQNSNAQVFAVSDKFNGDVLQIEELGFYFTVDNAAPFSVSDPICVNSSYIGPTLSITAINGNVIKARVTNFSQTDANNLETNVFTTIFNNNSDSANIVSFTRYGVFHKECPAAFSAEPLYYSQGGGFLQSPLAHNFGLYGAQGSFNNINDLVTTSNDNDFGILSRVEKTYSTLPNFSFPWLLQTWRLQISEKTSGNTLLQQVAYVFDYAGYDIDFTSQVATEIDLDNNSLSFRFNDSVQGESVVTIDNTLIDQALGALSATAFSKNFETEIFSNDPSGDYVTTNTFLPQYTQVVGVVSPKNPAILFADFTDMAGSQTVILTEGVDYTISGNTITVTNNTFPVIYVSGFVWMYNDGTNDIPLIISTPTNAGILDTALNRLKTGSYTHDVYTYDILNSEVNYGAAPFVRSGGENVNEYGSEISVYNESVGSLFIVPGNFDPTAGQQMSYQYPNALQRVSVSGVFRGKTFSAGSYARWNGIETVPFPEQPDSLSSIKIVFGGVADAKSGTYSDFVSAYEAANKLQGTVVIEVDYTGPEEIVIPAGTYNLTKIKFKDLSPKDTGVDKSYFSAGAGVVLKYDREPLASFTVFDLTGLRLRSTTAQGLFSWDQTSTHWITIGEGTYLAIEHNDIGRYFRFTDSNKPNNVYLNFEKSGYSSENIFETSDLTLQITSLYISDSANSPLPSLSAFSGTYSAFDPQKYSSIVYRNYSGLPLPSGSSDYNFTSKEYNLRGDYISLRGTTETVTEKIDSLASSNRIIFNYDEPIAKETITAFNMNGSNYVGDKIDNTSCVVIHKSATNQFISIMKHTTAVGQGVAEWATLPLADGSLAPGSCVAVTQRPNSTNSYTAEFVVLHAGTNNYGTLIKYSWVVGSITINVVGSRDNLTTYPWRGCTYLGNGRLAIFDSNFLGIYTGTLFDTLLGTQVASFFGGDLSQGSFYAKTLTANLLVVHRTGVGGANTRYYKFDPSLNVYLQIPASFIADSIESNVNAVIPVDKNCFLVKSSALTICQTVYLNASDSIYAGISGAKIVQSLPYLGLAQYSISLSPYRVLTEGTIYEFSYYLGDPEWLT